MSLLELRLNLEPDSSLHTIAAKSSRFSGVLSHLEFRSATSRPRAPAAAGRVTGSVNLVTGMTIRVNRPSAGRTRRQGPLARLRTFVVAVGERTVAAGKR